METCFNYDNRERAWFSSDELKWINKLHNLKEKYPELVEILREPEENDGCIYAKVPSSWFKMQPKRESNMTEEQKEELRQRLQNMREKKDKP